MEDAANAIANTSSTIAASTSKQNNKMWFLQFLRGVACLLIVYVHWQTFIVSPGTLSPYIYQSEFPQNYVTPTPVAMFGKAFGAMMPADFREVYIGLALFFIISGFIIPVSLERGGKVNYLIRRIARILPTAIACTALSAIAIIVGRYIEGNTAAPFSLMTVIANATFVRDILEHPYVDSAIWTLEVEVHFYIICFVISFFSGQKKALVIITMAIAFLLASIALKNNMGGLEAYRIYINIIAMNGCFILLMFIGMALYNYHAGNWSLTKTAFVTFALLVINNFTLKNYSSPIADVMYANHLFASLTFIIFMLVGEKLPYSKTIDRIAEISYPLYLLHGACGYVLFYIFYKYFNNTIAAFSTSWLIVITMTYIVHLAIERPSQDLGKILSKRIAALSFKRFLPTKA